MEAIVYFFTMFFVSVRTSFPLCMTREFLSCAEPLMKERDSHSVRLKGILKRNSFLISIAFFALDSELLALG